MALILNSLSLILIWLSLIPGVAVAPEKDKPNKKKAPVAKPLTTIAFGSCNRSDLPQPLWADILMNRPQLWIWLGGNVDTEASDLKALKANYNQQLQEPGYNALRESTTIIGTWDHNDYGKGSAGKEFQDKAESQSLFCDFIGEAEDSPLRQQEGIYSAHTYGPKGQQVKVILLDTRYHRDAPEKPVPAQKNSKKKKQKKSKAPTADILGEAQWKWLEKELRSNPAQLTIIGNSTQIIPEEHAEEKWADYPKSRERLLKLISRTNSEGVILLSGDRHMAEISQLEVDGRTQPVYEVTSSGLTHTVSRDYAPGANKHRVGEVVAKINFGLIQVDWEKREVALQIQGDRNRTYLSQTVAF
ncbi:alkaline phosphatase D family protein [Rufibacter roseus]|uniref:Alkaline phosphatase D family protein n=1 Tax=Rufibacter roseus TaxID=1567108 RepID=A0ABW2DI21_9BACT|nr:alkaline phosphatase D family protein [Rufibacter roseus]